jgi:hypothetical protein
MIKIGTILRTLKQYALNIAIFSTISYSSICSYKMFVNYENHRFSHDIAEFIIHKTSQELPLAISEDQKFINAILSSSKQINGLNDSDAYIINQLKNYIHPFDKIDKLNILKEVALQNVLLNMPSEQRNEWIKSLRLADTHKVFNRFYMKKNGVNIPIIYSCNNQDALRFSLLINNSKTE